MITHTVELARITGHLIESEALSSAASCSPRSGDPALYGSDLTSSL
jgi:hypothetical protein